MSQVVNNSVIISAHKAATSSVPRESWWMWTDQIMMKEERCFDVRLEQESTAN